MQSRETPRLRPSSRLLIGLASLVLMAPVAATTSPAWTALARGEATVQDRAEATPPTTVRPASSPLVGVWQRRDAWLWVHDGGTARLRWRTDWCQSDTRGPCDQVDGRDLSLGALAEMSLPNAGDPQRATLEGQVVAVNAPGPMQVGSVSLNRVADDLVVLRQGDRTLLLCRPPRDLNFCDAGEN